MACVYIKRIILAVKYSEDMQPTVLTVFTCINRQLIRMGTRSSNTFIRYFLRVVWEIKNCTFNRYKVYIIVNLKIGQSPRTDVGLG